MKKLLALLLAAMVGIMLAACDNTKPEEEVSPTDVITGGWTTPDSPVVSNEVKDVLAKATEKLTGACCLSRQSGGCRHQSPHSLHDEACH